VAAAGAAGAAPEWEDLEVEVAVPGWVALEGVGPGWVEPEWQALLSVVVLLPPPVFGSAALLSPAPVFSTEALAPIPDMVLACEVPTRPLLWAVDGSVLVLE
jgi:hypothetical protein